MKCLVLHLCAIYLEFQQQQNKYFLPVSAKYEANVGALLQSWLCTIADHYCIS